MFPISAAKVLARDAPLDALREIKSTLPEAWRCNVCTVRYAQGMQLLSTESFGKARIILDYRKRHAGAGENRTDHGTDAAIAYDYHVVPLRNGR
jgi:hypothetical protein